MSIHKVRAAGGLWRRFAATAQDRSGHPALIQGERMVDFAELACMAATNAAVLDDHGVKPGDRCLVWAEASAETAAMILGIWHVGGIVALVSDDAPLGHFVHAAAIVAPAIAIVSAAIHTAAHGSVSCPVILLRDETASPLDTLASPTIADTSPASILFTSGSSGRPKGVTQSHGNLVAGCAMVAEHLGLRVDDRIFCPVPWAFDYGYGQFLSTIVLGITQVLPTARNPFSMCDAIARHRPTVFVGLSSIFAQLIRGISPVRETDLSSLRLVTNTGGAIPPALYADVVQLFGHCEISLNYGLSETYRSAGLPVELAGVHPTSVGFAYPGVAICIMRDDGNEAATDETGEIVHRGTGVFLGYWGQPEQTALVRRPDPLWPHSEISAPMAVFTGDLGWKDADGRLFVKGRRDRQIKSMGVRVSPDEIESLLRSSGLVSDVAIVGVPHEMVGEMVTAMFVVADDAPDPVPQLKVFARTCMSQHMQPRAYHRVNSLPLTPNGKTDFGTIKAMLAGRP